MKYHIAEIIMKKIVVSDAVYNELCSRRRGRESISETLLRELKPVKKCERRKELEQLRKEPAITQSEFESRIGSDRT